MKVAKIKIMKTKNLFVWYGDLQGQIIEAVRWMGNYLTLEDYNNKNYEHIIYQEDTRHIKDIK